MHVSYKILCLLSIAQLGSLQAQVKNEPAKPAMPAMEYPSYASTIKNGSERVITIKVNYTHGGAFGPISLAGGSEIMLNEDFSGVCNVVVDNKQLTECIQKGRPVKLPAKTNYSMISYTEDKKGPRLIVQ